jgi:AcrR family transcriptional regulator
MSKTSTRKAVKAAPNSGGAARAKGTQRRADRFEEIVDASASIFRRKGYNATSLQEIADEVGLLKGSLYYYIETKEDLLAAVLERVHEAIAGQNNDWRAFEDDPLGALRSFVEGHLRLTLDNLTYAEVYFREHKSLGPERMEQIIAARDSYESDFRSLVRQANEAGLLRPGVTPAFAARAVFGIVNWVYYWYRPHGPLGVNEVVTELSDYAMASLIGRTGA